MGCGCCSHASAENEPLRVTVFGLENSGKTSLVQCLKTAKKLSPSAPCVSTHGVIAVHIRTDLHLLVFDCGGCKHQRHIWPHLMNNSDVILFTVDSADLPCMSDARDALFDLLVDENLTGRPLLVVFTKTDKGKHLHLKQLEERLDLSRIRDRAVQRVLFSSVTLDGLTLISSWLTYFSHRKLRGKDMAVSSSSSKYSFLHSLNLSTSSRTPTRSSTNHPQEDNC